MININDERAKRRAWLVFDRLLKRFERIIYRKARGYVTRQYLRAAKEIAQGNGFPRAIDAESSDFSKQLVAFYKVVMTAIGTLILEEDERRKDISTRTIFWNHVNRWIRNNVGKKITRINDTTLKRVKRIIKLGIDEGLSNQQIASRLTLLADIDSMKRALRIARTETHQTANKGSLEMAKEVKLSFKEWLSAKDERVRVAHLEANGQRVEIDEPFIVDGEELQFPGDPDGSPENTINCRCTQIYRDEDSQKRFKRVRRKYARV